MFTLINIVLVWKVDIFIRIILISLFIILGILALKILDFFIPDHHHEHHEHEKYINKDIPKIIRPIIIPI